MGTTISGTNPAGVTLTSAGDNPTTIAADAQLYGGLYVSYPGAWQVLNLGTVEGPDVGISLSSGGSIDNAALVSAAVAGVFMAGQAGTVVNSGTILSAGRAVYLGAGGGVTNQGGGTIAGYVGIAIGGDSATVVNAGTIMGTGAGDAVRFATGYANRMVIDPGAVFLGTVDGGNTIGAGAVSTLELAAYTTAGTLSGLGTQFINFAQVTVDIGAQWVLDATDTVAAGVTLANAGTLTGPVTLAAGAELSNGATGTVTAAGSAAVYAGTGDAATVVNAGTILSTGLYAAIGLGGGTVINQAGATIAGYDGIGGGPGGALTVINGGSIIATGGVAITLSGYGSVTNQSGGTISGYQGIYAADGLSVVNDGTIIGQATGSARAAGIELSGSGTVTNQTDGLISGANGIDGSDAAVDVVNDGTITGSTGFGLYAGVYLVDGGSVTNDSTGLIQGYQAVLGGAGGTLTVVNQGTIASLAPDGYGIQLLGGGSVTNQSGGVITGYDGVHGTGNPLTVVNAGTILGDPTSNASVGIWITDGGMVSNQATGLISGGDGVYAGSAPLTVVNAGTIIATGSISPTHTAGFGICLAGGGSVTNQSGGTISGYQGGIYARLTDPVTVVNDGTIAGTGSASFGVYLAGGGTVTNQSDGTISGYLDGIYGGFTDPVTVVNDGTIAGTGSASLGVYLAGGGYVTNQSGGTISGYGAGIVASVGALTVVNAGTIAATGALAETVVLVAGGSVSNQETGLITGGVGVFGAPSGAVTLQNAGSIVTNGVGVVLLGGGYVTNQAGGVIGGYIGITNKFQTVSVLNAGTIIGGGVTNQVGGTISGYYGISGYDLTVVNTGTIAGNATSGLSAGIIGRGSSLLTNQAGGTISGYYGISGDGSLTVVNTGIITGNATASLGTGIAAGPISWVTNQAGGAISGYTGLYGDGLLTVVNSGTITGNATSSHGTGILVHGSLSATNLAGGTISGYNGVLSADDAADGYGPLTLANAGTIIANETSGLGVGFLGGGSVTNQNGGVIIGATGIEADGAAGYVVNGGTIIATGSVSATHTAGVGVGLFAGGSVTNQNGGTIAGPDAIYGGQTGPITVVNGGIVAATGSTSVGVYLAGGGSVTNQTAGVISGYTGIIGRGGVATVDNAGTITGSVGYAVVLEAGGSVTNQSGGTITGYLGGIFSVVGGATVVNAGSIAGTAALGRGVVLFDGGLLLNQGGGTISGYQGITTFNDAATIENAGAIIGTQHAIRFGTYTNRLIVDPGASFGGVVDGGNTIGAASVSTLELASASTAGTLSGIGTQFVDFAQTTIDAGAAWTLTGGNSLAAGTTLENAGTLTVLSAGFYDGGLVANDGSIAIGPAGATLTDLTGIGDLSLAAGTTLDVLGTVSAGETIAFAAGSNMLDVDPAGFAGQIDDFTVGDTIGLSGVTDAVSAGIVNADTLEIQRSGNPAIDLILDPTQDYSGNLYSVTADGAVTENAFCFLRDTLIRTDRGEVKVQNLIVGDRVVTLSGTVRPITWIGSGEALVRPGRRSAATPVIVRRNAVADGVPWYDLRVTKGHALFIDGVLIPVEFLINHRSIHWDDHQAVVTFYHIELETHDVLIANGMPAESYRDDGNRWLFGNANSGWDQLPKPPCAPVLTDGPIVDAIWQRLCDRAPGPVEIALTEYPDLHLLVDGVRVNASARFGTPHVFRLESRPHRVRVVSHAGAPAELGFARDPRRLGVAIAQIMVSKGRRLQVMEANDPALTDGFHACEPSLGLRWTDGDATLPASLFEGFDGPMLLVLRLGGSTLYRAFGQASAQVAA
jgi:fibronectin-binding autotransporter adhesin